MSIDTAVQPYSSGLDFSILAKIPYLTPPNTKKRGHEEKQEPSAQTLKLQKAKHHQGTDWVKVSLYNIPLFFLLKSEKDQRCRAIT